MEDNLSNNNGHGMGVIKIISDISPKIMIVLTAYATFLSVIYEFGYWSQFDINVFQFMTVQEIVKSSLYPLAATLVSVTIGIILGSRKSLDLQPGGGAQTKTGIFLQKYTAQLNIIFIIFMTAMYLAGGVNKWMSLALLGIIYLTFLSHYYGLFDFLNQNRVHKLVLPPVIIFYPILSYAIGADYGSKIIAGTFYREANINDKDDKYKYIGHAGEYVFLSNIDTNKIYMINSSEIKKLTLAKKSI